MIMTLPIVLAIAGSIALLIGLFGGGIKAKEIEVPKISIWARIFSSLVGVLLIGIAIRLPNPPPADETPTATPIFIAQPAPTQQQIVATSTTPPTVRPADPPILAPKPTINPTDTLTPTAEPVLEVIPFASPSEPNLLNTAFVWQPGGSSTNAYELASSSNAVTLIADGNTHQWAELDSEPVIFFQTEGNFETQVKVVFNPIWGHELAALGIRSTDNHNTWLRLGSVYAVFSEGSGPEQHIVLDIDDKGQGGKIRTSPYAADMVYLRIERQGSVFAFYYSSNGNNWTVLQSGYIAEMPANVEIFLTVGSWGDGGASAEFHDFTVLRK